MLITYTRRFYNTITVDGPSNNITLQCLLYSNFTLDYRWMILMEALLAASHVLIPTAVSRLLAKCSGNRKLWIVNDHKLNLTTRAIHSASFLAED